MRASCAIVRALHIGILSNPEEPLQDRPITQNANNNLFFTTNVCLNIEASYDECTSSKRYWCFSVQLEVSMIDVLFRDERGAVSVDWVTLTAAVLLFSVVVVYSLMNDSGGYLLDEFEVLNARYENNAESVSALSTPPSSTLGALMDAPIKIEE
jgi:hypothetical protein